MMEKVKVTDLGRVTLGARRGRSQKMSRNIVQKEVGQGLMLGTGSTRAEPI
jgi:hypothetical protein